MRKLRTIAEDGVQITAGKIVLTLNHGSIATYEVTGYATREWDEEIGWRLCLYAEDQRKKHPVMTVPLELVKTLTINPLS